MRPDCIELRERQAEQAVVPSIRQEGATQLLRNLDGLVVDAHASDPDVVRPDIPRGRRTITIGYLPPAVEPLGRHGPVRVVQPVLLAVSASPSDFRTAQQWLKAPRLYWDQTPTSRPIGLMSRYRSRA